jgi:hypothetical protein
MLDDGNVQTLLCDQHFDVAAAKGSGHGCVEEWLGEKAARERERLDRRFVGALAALDSGKTLDPEVGKTGGTEDEATAGRLFERDAGLHDLGIFLEGPGERGIKGESFNVR